MNSNLYNHSYTAPFGTNPPVLDGTTVHPLCPQCHLGPCITVRPPIRQLGSSAPSLGNLAKHYTLYRTFWRVLRQLGVWSHPEYLLLKATKKNPIDVELCNFSKFTLFNTSVLHVLIYYFRMFEDYSPIFRTYHIKTLNHQLS